MSPKSTLKEERNKSQIWLKSFKISKIPSHDPTRPSTSFPAPFLRNAMLNFIRHFPHSFCSSFCSTCTTSFTKRFIHTPRSSSLSYRTHQSYSTTISTTTMSAEKFKIALCQMPVCASKEKNLDVARDYLRRAASSGAKLAVLPECFNSPYDTSSFRQYAEPISTTSPSPSKSISMLLEMAKETGMFIVGGSIPEIDHTTDKIYNASVSVSPQGNILAIHRKAHLFDIDVPGKIKFTESSVLSAGNTPTTFPLDNDISVAVSICYDIRFPELTAVQTRGNLNAKLVVLPGAFNLTTGPAHWELLLRARAVDNQVFIAACSPARDENPNASYKAWGHSMIVDPWGTVLNSATHEPELIVADIDMERLHQIRTSIPIRTQRREDIYQLRLVENE